MTLSTQIYTQIMIFHFTCLIMFEFEEMFSKLGLLQVEHQTSSKETIATMKFVRKSFLWSKVFSFFHASSNSLSAANCAYLPPLCIDLYLYIDVPFRTFNRIASCTSSWDEIFSPTKALVKSKKTCKTMQNP